MRRRNLGVIGGVLLHRMRVGKGRHREPCAKSAHERLQYRAPPDAGRRGIRIVREGKEDRSVAGGVLGTHERRV